MRRGVYKNTTIIIKFDSWRKESSEKIFFAELYVSDIMVYHDVNSGLP